jgi:hypothetical protein
VAGQDRATIGALAQQIVSMRNEQADLRALVMDVLREMLRISALQAEANVSFMRLVEAQQETYKAQMNQGPGSSRDRTEAQEAAEWQRSIDESARPFERDL